MKGPDADTCRMLPAEEKGITSANVDSFLSSNDPAIRRLLGVEGDTGKSLELDNKWPCTVVKQVGTYGEMWDRNITPMGVPCGTNNISTKGRLRYPTRRRSGRF